MFPTLSIISKAPSLPCQTHQLADPVQYWVDDLLANGVVTTGIVVRGILFPSDELLWMEELPVWAISDLICKGINHIVRAQTTGCPQLGFPSLSVVAAVRYVK